jgi:hypothetical protein
MILKPQMTMIGNHVLYGLGDYLIVSGSMGEPIPETLFNALYADPEGIDERTLISATMNALKDQKIIAVYHKGRPMEPSSVKHFRYPNVLTPENMLYWNGEIYTFEEFKKATS